MQDSFFPSLAALCQLVGASQARSCSLQLIRAGVFSEALHVMGPCLLSKIILCPATVGNIDHKGLPFEQDGKTLPQGLNK